MKMFSVELVCNRWLLSSIFNIKLTWKIKQIQDFCESTRGKLKSSKNLNAGLLNLNIRGSETTQKPDLPFFYFLFFILKQIEGRGGNLENIIKLHFDMSF